jgi:uncharacterized protein YicC (UPF0701 family)
MDQQEIETRIKNIDERTTRIEQILPRLATKEDLQGSATKQDLQGFATKQDLQGFATKQDLQGFATKQDLQGFATKQDLQGFATKQDLQPFATKQDLQPFATKDDVREEGERTRRHFDVVAEAMKEEIGRIAEGHAVVNARVDGVRAEHKADIAGHERRITKLEAAASKRR